MKLIPIDPGIDFDCSDSDLLRFDWQDQTADFIIPGDDENALRVSFRNDVIVRIMDEMPLAMETDPATWEGLVPGHFAYRVEDGWSGGGKPEVWGKAIGLGSPTHYRFVTGWGCLEVLTHGEPEFTLVRVVEPDVR